MSLQWNNSTVLLPKRDVDTSTSVNVLCYVDGYLVEGYYTYDTERWNIYNADDEDYTDGEFNPFDVTMWTYFIEPVIEKITAKIDGE
jgi:hypothetical protein